MARTYKTEGIIIKRINFSEADRLLTVFSKHHGKLRLVAKGIRRLTSRKKGHLELFNQVCLFIAKGKNLDLITEAETINNFSRLRKNLPQVQTAFLFCELADRLTAENQSHPQVYQLLFDCLHKLSLATPQALPPDNLIIYFEKNLLQLLGFGLPKVIKRQSLEQHIISIIERPINSHQL
jgi:DNA repair protein RecO (recombination protein O)